MNWDTVEEVFVIIAFGSVGGAISGAFVANYFSNRRDKSRRKLQLLAFLNAWQSDFLAGRDKYVPEANLSRAVFALFDDFRIELIAKATGVELDYSGIVQGRFKALETAIIDMTPGQLDIKQGREKLNAALNDLIDFLRKN